MYKLKPRKSFVKIDSEIAKFITFNSYTHLVCIYVYV